MTLDGPSLISVVRLSHIVYAIVAPLKSRLPQLKLYQWVSTQFDEVYAVNIEHNCAALEAWHRDGSIFVAFSYISNKLVVKRLIEKDKSLSTVQILNAKASAIKHFEDARGNYLLSGAENHADLYRSTGFSFTHEARMMFSKPVIDVAVHNIGSESLIVVILQNEVHFMARGYPPKYTNAGMLSFKLFSAPTSVRLWHEGSSLLMIPVSNGQEALYIYELRLQFEVTALPKQTIVGDCLQGLNQKVDSKGKLLNFASNMAKKAWTAQSKVQASSLVVNGTVKSLTKVAVRRLVLQKPKLEEARRQLLQLVGIVSEINSKISGVVRKSNAQTLTGHFTFSEILVANGTLNRVDSLTTLNNVRCSRLKHCLRIKGYQLLQNNLIASKVVCTTVNTGRVNSIKMNDFVLLSKPHQVMHGTYIFNNVSGHNIDVKSSTINGLSLTSFLLRGSKPQTVEGVKVFKRINASVVRTNKDVNQMNLETIRVAKLLSSQNLSPRLHFASKVVIRGNLSVGTLNGKTVKDLWQNSVHKQDGQALSGKNFRSLTFWGSLTLEGLLNGVNIKNLVTLGTDQSLSGNITLKNITVLKNLEAGYVNSLQLAKEAVHRHKDGYWIEGLKIFTRVIDAVNITLGESVTIDGLDPSEEVAELIFKDSEGHLTSLKGSLNVWNLWVKGNLEIRMDSDSFLLPKLLKDVWLKSREQNVFTLTVVELSANQMEVLRINNISMDSVVPVEGDISIKAVKYFADEVQAMSLSMMEGKQLNLPDQWRSSSKIAINGNITLDSSVVSGDLIVSESIKAINFLHSKHFQWIENEFKFDEAHVEDFATTELLFEFVNGINFTEFYEEAVLLSSDHILQNKNFTSIIGESLTCDGLLNGVSLSNVATTNTEQRFFSPSLLFKGPIHLESRLIVSTFFEGIHLDNVVLTDEEQAISNKIFRKVDASHITVYGLINDIDVPHVDTKVFYKDQNNSVFNAMVFESSLSASNLQVISDALIDGVAITDLILLKESAHLKHLTSKSLSVERLVVIGLINQCNLTNILMNGLRSKASAQTFANLAYIESLVVEGNLKSETINGVWLSEWISYMQASNKKYLEDKKSLIFETLAASNVIFRGRVNENDLDFLTEDAVRNSYEQYVNATKTFLDVKVVNSSFEKLFAEHVSGINVTDLFESAINRVARKQTILEMTTLTNISAKNIAVNGRLNGLKLPGEVILSNKSEHIMAETILHTLNVSRLEVLGKIGGVNLSQFIDERVTLNSSQNVSAELTFLRDTSINGSLSIDGRINDVQFCDIVNMMELAPVEGTVVFTEDVEVQDNVIVNDTVNELSLKDLEENTSRTFKNETIKEMIKFTNLTAADLICEKLNGEDLADFFEDVHSVVHQINDILDEYTESILEQAEDLRTLMDSQERMLSIFGYFDLQEALKMKIKHGKIERFLPVYEFGLVGEPYELQVTQLVIWVTKFSGKCVNTKSYIADILEDGFIKATIGKRGRVFPLSLRSQWKNVVGFIVQAEHIRKCLNKPKLVVVETMLPTGGKVVNKIECPANSVLEEAKLLELQDIYLLLALSRDEEDRMFLYRYNLGKNAWKLHQTFHSQPFSSLDWRGVETPGNLFLMPDFYLAVSGGMTNPGVTVYEWDFEEEELIQRTNFTTTASTRVLWVNTDSDLFLLVAKEKSVVEQNLTTLVHYNEPLSVYALEDETMVLRQEIPVLGARFLEMFVLSGEKYVLASSHHRQTLFILQYRGYSGFEIVQEVFAPGITSTSLYTVESDLYLAISSSIPGYSRVLKAAIRGGRRSIE